MGERITRGMLERQFQWWCENHPVSDPECHWILEKHRPGDRVYWRICYGRKDHKGGLHDGIVTSVGYSTRELFECLHFANQSDQVAERLARLSG